MDIIERFKAVADPGYAIFSKKMIPSSLDFIGVRSPIYKKISKEVKKENPPYEDWKDSHFFEVKMMYGIMLLNDPKLTKDDKIKKLIPYLRTVDNWAIIDSLSGIPLFDTKEEVLAFVTRYRQDNAPFLRRYCYTILLTHHRQFDDPTPIFDLLQNDDHYYVQMAEAWLLSMVYLNHRDQTFEYLRTTTLNKTILHKTIQKMIDSFRVPEEEKARIRTLRR